MIAAAMSKPAVIVKISIDRTRRRLRRFSGQYRVVSDESGLGYSWVSKFASGERGKRPSFDLITRLIAALDKLEAQTSRRKRSAR